jgi:hypothetical protein
MGDTIFVRVSVLQRVSHLKPLIMTTFLFRLAVALFFFCHAGALRAADSVYVFAEAHLQATVPGSHWHLQPRQEKNGRVIYVFKRDPISDSSGRNIIPNFAVVIETIEPNTDVVTYSVNKRANNAFHMTSMFTREDGTIKLINAVGYKGVYTDALPHTVYVIHAINGHKGFQVILDTTTDTFGAMDAEFLAILHSLRVK